jgi:adenylate kinase family enzyme
MKYSKDTPRLTVKYINADTEETVFEINDRTWMNVGELLSDHYVNEIVKQHINNPPKNLMVLVVGEYSGQ